MSIEGKIPLQADAVPNNDNPRGFVTSNEYVKGAPQVFDSVAKLVEFHPNRMKNGMPATVFNYPSLGVITELRLAGNPDAMKDQNGDSIVTLNNFDQFWVVKDFTKTNSSRVYAFSADGPGGGAPVYPYTIETESNWLTTRDDSRGHKWMRFRDDDIDENADGIFDNWSSPIPISGIFAPNDYIKNYFLRQAVSSTVHSNSTALSIDKYYIVESGSVLIEGDISLNDAGEFGSVTSATFTVGRVFKYAAANTYTFNTATVTETLKSPPRTINGVPNSEPIGWIDTIPSGTDQLWEINGQLSVYGVLKSDWILRKIVESPNYIRYSNSPYPHPDTIVDTNTTAESGSIEDDALIAAGWETVYNGQNYIAIRTDGTGSDLFTSWFVEKINEESGEYEASVYKLFDINLDPDSPFLVAPTDRDPTREGWSETPVTEGDSTKINYVSKARKFFNGELKTPWAKPVPYTGKDAFNDFIIASPADNFKYSDIGVVTPTEITLEAKLLKGVLDFQDDASVTITYEWRRVFNDGVVLSNIADDDTAQDFYYLGPSGSYRNGQRLLILPAAINGQATFRVTQTVALTDGNTLIFEDEITLVDVSDGIDAVRFEVTADNSRTIYDSLNLVFVPATIILRAYWSNLTPTLHWYLKVLGVWTEITNGSPYIIGGNTCAFDAVDLFGDDALAEELHFAVSTHSTNPDSADQISNFSDYITIVKLASDSVGSPGVDALSVLLNNESHTLVLNSITISPQSGEIGSSGKAISKIEMYDGPTKLEYGTDYTLLLTSDNANVTFDQQTNGVDGDVFVDTWNVGERRAVCLITITYGSIVLTKKFSVSSTLDAPGAIVLDIDSDAGFLFTKGVTTAKNLSAKLYNSALSGSQLQVIRATQSTIAAFAAASAGYVFVQYSHVVLIGSTGPLFAVYRYNGGDKTNTASYSLLSSSDYYTFRWKIASSFGSQTTDPLKQVSISDILISTDVTVEVYLNSILRRSRTVSITDVNDGKIYRVWTDNATKPASNQLITNQVPVSGGAFGTGEGSVTVNGVVWFLATASYWLTHTPKFAQDGEYINGSYSYSAVYSIQGTKGDQGPSGNFFFPMYKANSTTLGAGGTSSTLAQMTAAGWTATIPTSGVIYKTERIWTGQGVTFDLNGYPSTAPVSGTLWTPAARVSGTDGSNGNPGPAGPGYNGVTYTGVDGSGGNVYSLNPVNGASAASIVAPKGATGPSGAIVTGGTKYGVSNLFSNNSFVLGGNVLGFTPNPSRAYPSTSFTLPVESNWKPYIKFTIQAVGDEGSTTDVFYMYIQRSSDNVTWGSTYITVAVRTVIGGSYGEYSVEHVDNTAVNGQTYYYRLVVRSTTTDNNYFSSNAGYCKFLVPG